ncbi:MAG: pseudouridine-5'-phosphate glycosidase [Anaerolineaceae bacterium]|nr:pseudouridine-5'-phosphate glycosidase [Anaerolineaceae bacterium]
MKEFIFSPEVKTALKNDQPVVALESTLITHGLPYPENIEIAQALENEVIQQGAVPATIAFIDGKIHIGLTEAQLEALAQSGQTARKISRKDFAIAIARKETGGTTVTGTLIAANYAGIKVFATGGIGGVHREAPFDISADLNELSKTPLIVVCAGAKAILDLPATVEYLETVGVPILGYQTDEFPAFYARNSGLPVTQAVDSPQEVVDIANTQWNFGLQSSILVTAPPPAEYAVKFEEIEPIINEAVQEAKHQNIAGPKVTPFLLQKVSELSKGKSMHANLALLRNNAMIAGKISVSLQKNKRKNSEHLKQI